MFIFSIFLVSVSQASDFSLPRDFEFCVATSAHQVEGGNTRNDWWEFEHRSGTIARGEKSGRASDQWNRWESDVELIRSLGAKSYRFSIEWSRLEISPGNWDVAAIQNYRRKVEYLLSRGIQPIISLYHFTFPLWVRKKGGWEWDGIAPAFQNFTRVVFSQIAPEGQRWITIVEPMLHIFLGYRQGEFPPGEKRDFKNLLNPLLGMLRSHAAAYRELHRLAALRNRTVQVGMSRHLRTYDPQNPLNPFDRIAAAQIHKAWNWSIEDAVQTGIYQIKLADLDVKVSLPELRNTLDYLGINYYSGDLVHYSPLDGNFSLHTRSDLPKSDMGWDIYPKGLGRLIREGHKRYPQWPIYVTENGIADADDSRRGRFLVDHLREIRNALDDGIPVFGYCHWSLIDNFEWAHGFKPRFGLYEVDYKTQKRTMRPSARVFQELARGSHATLRPDTKWVIMHADDLAVDPTINSASLRALKNGDISSASVIVPGPQTTPISEAMRANPDLDIGVHWALNSEWKEPRWAGVLGKTLTPSIHDGSGHLHKEQWKSILFGNGKEVASELRAQILAYRKTIGQPTHFDSHMGTSLMRPDFLKTSAQLAREFKTPVFIPKFSIEMLHTLKKRFIPTKPFLDVYKSENLDELAWIDHFHTMTYDVSTRNTDERTAQYDRILGELKSGVSLLIFHLTEGDERSRKLQGLKPGEIDLRDFDRRYLERPRTKEILRSIGAEVISWKALAERMKGIQ